jgi:hypothetical protein
MEDRQKRLFGLDKDREDPHLQGRNGECVEVPRHSARAWPANSPLQALPFVIPHCILALIPKSDSSQMRGNGTMEIIWKTITKIMNDRINENA